MAINVDEKHNLDEFFFCTQLPFQYQGLKGNAYMEVNLLPFYSFGCILRSVESARFSLLTILGPKLLVSCMRSVMSTTHTKTPKTNHANAPVTCWVLCAISYLQSKQQQRLDEKLILPPSLCPSPSACLSVSIILSVCLWHVCLSVLIYVV